MPFSQKAEIKFVAVNDLQGMGDTEGPALLYSWSPPSPFPRLIPWLVLLVLLALPANRTLKAWWIAVPLVIVSCALIGVRSLLEQFDVGDEGQIFGLYKALMFGGTAVWLLLPYLKKSYRIFSILLMLVVWGIIAGVSLLLGRGSSIGIEAMALTMAVCVVALFTVLSLTFGALLCRKQYRPFKLSLWAAAFAVALPCLVVAPIMIIAALSDPNVPLAGILGGAAGFGAGAYAILLSFLLLSFLNSHYRESLKEVFHLGNAFPPPVATAPPAIPALQAQEKPMERTGP